MENGSKIRGNSKASGPGGGTFVASGGVFTMNGRSISDNNADYAGGAYVEGTLTMNGGIISGNTATAGTGVTLDSSVSGSTGGWEEIMPTTSLQAAAAIPNSKKDA